MPADTPPQKPIGPGGPDQRINKQKILVVEDDTDIQQIVSLYLTEAGYGVDFVNSAKAMYAHFKAGGRPDLVILDLGLPDADGIDVTEQIRAFSSVPIFILTGSQSHDDKITALKHGADDYLTKPFDPQELSLRVDKLLSRTSAPEKGRRAADQSQALQRGRRKEDHQPGERRKRTERRSQPKPQSNKQSYTKPLIIGLALIAVLAVGIGLYKPSPEQAPPSDQSVVAGGGPAAVGNRMAIAVTATCDGPDAVFTVTNTGERWPAPGEIRVYIVSSQATIMRRRLTMSLNQRATFRAKGSSDANYASRNTGSDGIGLWVKPTWYDREFKYDATVNCK